MQKHPSRESLQAIDISSLRAMLRGEETQEVPQVGDDPVEEVPTQMLPRMRRPQPPARLTPNDTWDLPPDPERVYPPLPGHWYNPRDWWPRWKAWLRRDSNMAASGILLGFVSVLVLVTAIGVAFAANETGPHSPWNTANGCYLAVLNDGTIDFLTGIHTTDGNFNGAEYVLAPGQQQPTIAAISGYVKNGEVHITMRDGERMDIVGRIEGKGTQTRIVFSFATFHPSDWNGYKNAVLNQGRR